DAYPFTIAAKSDPCFTMSRQLSHNMLSNVRLLQLIDKRVSHPVNGGAALTYDASIIEVALEATGDVMRPIVVFA
ncbi:hypothetical protein, partial [Aeromonas caviae]